MMKRQYKPEGMTTIVPEHTGTGPLEIEQCSQTQMAPIDTTCDKGRRQAFNAVLMACSTHDDERTSSTDP